MSTLEYNFSKKDILCRETGKPFRDENIKIMDLSYLDSLNIQLILASLFDLPLEMIILKDDTFLEEFLKHNKAKIDLRNFGYLSKEKYLKLKPFVKRFLFFYCEECQNNLNETEPLFCSNCMGLKCKECKCRCFYHLPVYIFPDLEKKLKPQKLDSIRRDKFEQISFKSYLFELIRKIPDEYIENFRYSDDLNKIIFPEFRDFSLKQIKYGVQKCLKEINFLEGVILKLYDLRGNVRGWWYVFKTLRRFSYRQKIVSYIPKNPFKKRKVESYISGLDLF